MQNLAGHPESSALCAAELGAAGIPLDILAQPYGEPQSRVGGALDGFTFRRAWYYWIVEGPMPLAQAEALNATHGQVVRVAGFAGGAPVAEWTEWRAPDGTPLYLDPTGEEAAKWEALKTRHAYLRDDGGRFVRSVDDVPGARGFVMSYHVDTAEGLRAFADTIRALSAVSIAA